MADSVSFSLVGGSALNERLLAAIEKGSVAAGAAMYQEGLEILAASIPITPIEFGNLRASGHVTLPIVAAGYVEVTIGFGGPAAPYAVFVHERTDVHHEPPTQAKYLEKPVLAAIPGMEARLAKRVGAILGI